MSTTNMTAVAETGDITTTDAYLRSVVLTADSDAATVVVRAGGSGGTVVLTLAALTGTTVATPDLGRVLCADGIHVSVTGTTPAVSVVFE